MHTVYSYSRVQDYVLVYFHHCRTPFKQFVTKIPFDISFGNIFVFCLPSKSTPFHLFMSLSCALRLCSQQQLRRCQSELNRQVKQSSSVIQEKVPFNDTSEYLPLRSRHLFENIYACVTDTITTLCPGVNSVTLHRTVILHSRRREAKAFKSCLSSQ